MDHGRELQAVDGVAQEGGFFADAFHQVDLQSLAGRRARRR